MATLLVDFTGEPDWCRQGKGLTKFKGFFLGEIVLDLNKTKAKIVHISNLKENPIRLGLLSKEGKIFATTTGFIFNISKIKNTNEVNT